VKIRWTMPAADQMRMIFDYIAADNPTAAGRTVKRIHEAIRSIAHMPYAGRIGRVDGTLEITVSGTSYVIAYKILENMIHVLAVFHGAQEWPEFF